MKHTPFRNASARRMLANIVPGARRKLARVAPGARRKLARVAWGCALGALAFMPVGAPDAEQAAKRPRLPIENIADSVFQKISYLAERETSARQLAELSRSLEEGKIPLEKYGPARAEISGRVNGFLEPIEMEAALKLARKRLTASEYLEYLKVAIKHNLILEANLAKLGDVTEFAFKGTTRRIVLVRPDSIRQNTIIIASSSTAKCTLPTPWPNSNVIDLEILPLLHSQGFYVMLPNMKELKQIVNAREKELIDKNVITVISSKTGKMGDAGSPGYYKIIYYGFSRLADYRRDSQTGEPVLDKDNNPVKILSPSFAPFSLMDKNYICNPGDADRAVIFLDMKM